MRTHTEIENQYRRILCGLFVLIFLHGSLIFRRQKWEPSMRKLRENLLLKTNH